MSAGQTGTAGPADRRIVIVLGPGRSGTSTVAGTLAMTGLEVPGRPVGANPTNPSGFYEPRWVVDFHKELLKAAAVVNLDASPAALGHVAELAAAPDVRHRLRTWLAERLETQPRLVVKDPRAVWFHGLWAETCADLGVEPGYVTMLRHPAEVSGSREMYHQKGQLLDARGSEVARIAGWINVAVISEQVTRERPRNFVRYTDLVSDWRSVLTRIATTQSLVLDPAPDASPHPVDDFIDPSLHRVRADWADVDIPEPLRELGERTWQAFTALADHGDTAEARAAVAEVREDYVRLVEDAGALVAQETRRRERAALRRGREAEHAAATAAGPSATVVARRVLGGLRRRLRRGRGSGSVGAAG